MDNGIFSSIHSNISEHKIMAMEEEKRNRIITCALKEFEKGFSNANTDMIAQKACISKGLLFHYFKTKKGLFLYLIQYSISTIEMEFNKQKFDSSDYLENVWKMSLLTIQLTFQYPLIYSFMTVTVMTMSKEWEKEILPNIYNPVQAKLEQCIKNFDSSLFRSDIDVKKAMNIIIWSVQGFSEALTKRYQIDFENAPKDYTDIMNELEDYINLLRKSFYN